ncbi:MAG: hypothetical protein ACHQ2Z_13685 [Elusimicrobiota bacterium]
MRYLLSFALSGMLGCLALLGFWQVHVQGIFDGPGALPGKIDELAAAWTAKNVPLSDRVITLVISDAESAGSLMDLPEAPSGRDRLEAWVRRAYLGRSRAAAEDSAFARAFARDSATIMWTRARYPSAQEENMTREIMAAIVKAHDAGAELDIVTQGLSAGPVLKALKRLEGTTRGGEKVGVNKLVTVGMNSTMLKRIDPFFRFGRPDDLREWSAVWKMDGDPPWTEIGVIDANAEYERYAAEQLYPAWGAKMEDLPPMVQELFRTAAPMRTQFDRRAPVAQAPARKQASAAGSAAAAAPAAPPRDSLAMIAVGGGQSMPEIPRASTPAATVDEFWKGRWIIRLTRAKYYGYRNRNSFSPGWDDNRDFICASEFPTVPGVSHAHECWMQNGQSDADPPLDEFPEAWAWVYDPKGLPQDATPCPRPENKNLERFKAAEGTIASRGKRVLANCTEAYPVACCMKVPEDSPAH